MRKRLKTIMISYKPFFKTLKEKEIKQFEFCKEHSVSTNLIHRLRNDGNINISTILKLMEDLGTSDYRDVIEIVAVKDDRY